MLSQKIRQVGLFYNVHSLEFVQNHSTGCCFNSHKRSYKAILQGILQKTMEFGKENIKQCFCNFKHDSILQTFFVPLVLTPFVPFLIMFLPRKEQEQQQDQMNLGL